MRRLTTFLIAGEGLQRPRGAQAEIKQDGSKAREQPATWNRSGSNELLDPCYGNLRSCGLTLVCWTVCLLWAPREATVWLLHSTIHCLQRNNHKSSRRAIPLLRLRPRSCHLVEVNTPLLNLVAAPSLAVTRLSSLRYVCVPGCITSP